VIPRSGERRQLATGKRTGLHELDGRRYPLDPAALLRDRAGARAARRTRRAPLKTRLVEQNLTSRTHWRTRQAIGRETAPAGRQNRRL
jgi:hypothetical protein